MEIWDAYDKNGQLLGFDLIRGETLKDGVYHLASDIVVKHTDGTYLLMQRSHVKDNFPGLYEVSAGGSALKGESPLECAKRELKEETGINKGTFTHLSSFVKEQAHCIIHQYLCITDCVKDSIVCQENETIGYKWVDKKEFIEFMNSPYCIKQQISRLKAFIDQEFNN